MTTLFYTKRSRVSRVRAITDTDTGDEKKTVVVPSRVEVRYTVEPHLSEPHGRHTIWPDNRGVRIDEGNRNSRSMGYRVGDN